MTRLAPLLLLLAAPALQAGAASPGTADAPADAKLVAAAFADLCLRAPHAWAAVRAAKRFGPVEFTDGDAPTVDAAANAHFTVTLDDVPVRVRITDSACGMEVAAVDVAKTLKRLDTQLAGIYTGTKVLEPAQSRPAPAGTTILRDLHFGRDGDAWRANVLVVAEGASAPRSLVLARRYLAVATGEAMAVEFAPSEDITGRAVHPPRFPKAALQACANGTAVMRVTVDAAGDVQQIVVDQSAGRPDLDEAAVDAARKWRYVAGMRDGVLVGGDIRVPMRFNTNCRSRSR